jgi:hypothetical protein
MQNWRNDILPRSNYDSLLEKLVRKQSASCRAIYELAIGGDDVNAEHPRSAVATLANKYLCFIFEGLVRDMFLPVRSYFLRRLCGVTA